MDVQLLKCLDDFVLKHGGMAGRTAHAAPARPERCSTVGLSKPLVFAPGLDGLTAGIIKLTCLANGQTTRSKHQDLAIQAAQFDFPPSELSSLGNGLRMVVADGRQAPSLGIPGDILLLLRVIWQNCRYAEPFQECYFMVLLTHTKKTYSIDESSMNTSAPQP